MRSMGLISGLLSLVAAVAIVPIVPTGAVASTYSFTDPGKATGTLDTDTGVLTVTNLLVNPNDVVGAISGLYVNFNAAPTAPSLTDQDGDLIKIKKNGPGTFVPGEPSNWVLSASLFQIFLNANHSCTSGGAPCHLIIGPGGANNYDNANGSIKSHSPFIFQTATFVIAGITDLVVESVRFAYGTGPTLGDTITTSCDNCGPEVQAVPLPAAVWLMGTVLGGAGLTASWRRRRRKAPHAA